MNFLRYNLWKLKRSSGPSRAFRSGLWGMLDEQWRSKHLPLPWYRVRSVRFAVTGLASLILVASGGTSVYAYTSPEVTEGTPLYAIKHTVEFVEEKMNRTPEARAHFYLKQLDRREAEREVLKRRGDNLDHIEEQISTVESKLQETDQELDRTPVSDPNLHTEIQTHLERLKHVKNQAEKAEWQAEGVRGQRENSRNSDAANSEND